MSERKHKEETVEGDEEEETAIATPSQRTGLTRGFDRLFDDFRRSFDEMMTPFFPWTGRRTALRRPTLRYPAVDLIDRGSHYKVTAELPGFNKETVDVQADRDRLEIRAERETERKEEEQDYLHRERTYAAFQRTINFPEDVMPEKIEGTMEDGILEIEVPKREPTPEPKMRKVKLK